MLSAVAVDVNVFGSVSDHAVHSAVAWPVSLVFAAFVVVAAAVAVVEAAAAALIAAAVHH